MVILQKGTSLTDDGAADNFPSNSALFKFKTKSN